MDDSRQRGTAMIMRTPDLDVPFDFRIIARKTNDAGKIRCGQNSGA